MNKYLIPLIVILSSFLIITITSLSNEIKEKKRAINNLNEKVREYKTKTGRLVKKNDILVHDTRELKQVLKMKENELSSHQKKLYMAGQTIKDLNLKLKDVENYTSSSLEENSDYRVKYVVKEKLVEIDSIKTDHLLIAFEVINDSSLHVTHQYRNKIETIVDLYKERNDGSIRNFPRLYFWEDWKKAVNTVSQDTNAVITNMVSINFQ